MFSQVPVARASILWLIGEYCERVPKIAPDVLRKTAKSFTNEDDLVKLQILNLGAKLYLTNSKQVRPKYTRGYIYSHSRFFYAICIVQSQFLLNKQLKPIHIIISFFRSQPKPNQQPLNVGCIINTNVLMKLHSFFFLVPFFIEKICGFFFIQVSRNCL